MTRVDPSACRWFGLPKEGHMGQWHAEAGWHTWTEPMTEQRYAAIRTNAAERKATATQEGAREAAQEAQERPGTRQGDTGTGTGVQGPHGRTEAGR